MHTPLLNGSIQVINANVYIKKRGKRAFGRVHHMRKHILVSLNTYVHITIETHAKSLKKWA